MCIGKMNGKETVVRKYKLYLAGPEVFLPRDLEEHEDLLMAIEALAGDAQDIFDAVTAAIEG